MNSDETQKHQLTLKPLLSDGPDALDTHHVPGLAKATLTGLELQSGDQSLEITYKAKNIFTATTATRNQLIPRHATLVQATFELDLDGARRPNKLIIRPPDTVIIQSRGDTSLIFQWLDKSHLRTLAAILLALATAIAPALDDDDGDEDDCPSDRHATLAPT